MIFSGVQKYFLIIMLSCGIAKGSNALFSSTHLHFFSASTNLHNDTKKISQSTVIEFLEEFDIDENSDEFHTDYSFTSPNNDAFDFVIFNHSKNHTPKNFSFKITPNQKIHVLNCTFLI